MSREQVGVLANQIHSFAAGLSGMNFWFSLIPLRQTLMADYHTWAVFLVVPKKMLVKLIHHFNTS